MIRSLLNKLFNLLGSWNDFIWTILSKIIFFIDMISIFHQLKLQFCPFALMLKLPLFKFDHHFVLWIFQILHLLLELCIFNRQEFVRLFHECKLIIWLVIEFNRWFRFVGQIMDYGFFLAEVFLQFSELYFSIFLCFEGSDELTCRTIQLFL